MSGRATASFSAAGTGRSSRVSRSWKSVTTIGFTTTRKPQVAGARPWAWTSEIGRTTSNET